MNKRILIISAALLSIILAAGGFLLVRGGNEQQSNKMSETTPVRSTNSTGIPETAPIEEMTPTNAVPGKYIDYKADVIATTSGTKLLFFHAPWCPQCRDIDTDIKASVIPSNTTIIKVDYDSNQSLRQKYGVTLQTTIVKVDDQGELIKKYVAYDSPTLDSIIINLL